MTGDAPGTGAGKSHSVRMAAAIVRLAGNSVSYLQLSSLLDTERKRIEKMKSSMIALCVGALAALAIGGVLTAAAHGELITSDLVLRFETAVDTPYTLQEGTQDRIKYWNDQAGTATNAAQTSTNYQPYLLTGVDGTPTGKPALDFRGTGGTGGQYLTTAAVADLDAINTLSWFVVYNLDATTYTQAFFQTKMGSTYNWSGCVYQYGAGPPVVNAVRSYARDGGGVQKRVDITTTDTENWHIVTGVVTPTGVSEWLDGVAGTPLSATIATPSTCASVRIAHTNDASNNCGLNGQIAAILVYKTALGETDRQAVETYLRETYIQVPEPSTLLLLVLGAMSLCVVRRR